MMEKKIGISMVFFNAVSITAILFLTSSCTLQSLVVNEMANMVEVGAVAIEQGEDPELIKSSIPSQITLLEVMLANDPSNAKLLALLSRLYGSYAFGFIEYKLDELKLQDEDEEALAEVTKRARGFYKKGLEYGKKSLLELYPDCSLTLEKVKTMRECLKLIEKENVGSLFWYGFNMAALINISMNSVAIISKAPNAKNVMERVLEIDPQTYHGSAYLFLMAYWARSPMMGGDLKKSLAYYHKLKKLSEGRFLFNDLFFAKFYLVQKQEEEMFAKTIRQVLNTKKASWQQDPSLNLMNQLAKKRASLYLKYADFYF